MTTVGAIEAAQLPEQGQMVNVRSRNWMVAEVSASTASTLPTDRLQTDLESPQHFITLSSVENDDIAKAANLDGDELGYLLGTVAKLKKIH